MFAELRDSNIQFKLVITSPVRELRQTSVPFRTFKLQDGSGVAAVVSLHDEIPGTEQATTRSGRRPGKIKICCQEVSGRQHQNRRSTVTPLLHSPIGGPDLQHSITQTALQFAALIEFASHQLVTPVSYHTVVNNTVRQILDRHHNLKLLSHAWAKHNTTQPMLLKQRSSSRVQGTPHHKQYNSTEKKFIGGHTTALCTISLRLSVGGCVCTCLYMYVCMAACHVTL